MISGLLLISYYRSVSFEYQSPTTSPSLINEIEFSPQHRCRSALSDSKWLTEKSIKGKAKSEVNLTFSKLENIKTVTTTQFTLLVSPECCHVAQPEWETWLWLRTLSHSKFKFIGTIVCRGFNCSWNYSMQLSAHCTASV